MVVLSSISSIFMVLFGLLGERVVGHVIVIPWLVLAFSIKQTQCQEGFGDFGKHRWSPFIKNLDDEKTYHIFNIRVNEGLINLEQPLASIPFDDYSIAHVELNQPYASPHFSELNSPSGRKLFRASLKHVNRSSVVYKRYKRSSDNSSEIFDGNSTMATTIWPLNQTETTTAISQTTAPHNVSTTLSTTTSPDYDSTTTKPIPAHSVVEIAQIGDLDREAKDQYIMSLLVYNANGKLASIPTVLVVDVLDANDNAPIFREESLSSVVNTTATKGDIVGQLIANDADIGINSDLRYSILEGSQTVVRAAYKGTVDKEIPESPWVDIVPTTGSLLLVKDIQSEEMPATLTFTVIVKDNGDDYVGNRASATANIVFSDNYHRKTNGSTISTKTKTILIISICGGFGVLLIVVVIMVILKRRKKLQQDNGQLTFMLDDQNLLDDNIST